MQEIRPAGTLLEADHPPYQVRLEVFEGPLDLLLFLIRKKKIDVHNIPMAVITRDYLEYLQHKERINLDREAEFLLMAALLIYIKSQMLLPREEPELEEDPRRFLVNQIIEHQKMRAASTILREKEEAQSLLWTRMALPPFDRTDEVDLEEISLFELAETFFTLMKRKEAENFRLLKAKSISIEKKMREIIALLEEQLVLDFLDYFNEQESVEEAVISFFSLLELIKARLVLAVQESLFQSIKVWLRKDAKRP